MFVPRESARCRLARKLTGVQLAAGIFPNTIPRHPERVEAVYLDQIAGFVGDSVRRTEAILVKIVDGFLNFWRHTSVGVAQLCALRTSRSRRI